MQAAPFLSNFDIFAEAGANAALVKGDDVTVSNGQVSIEFDNLAQTAKVNAIEILPGVSGPSLLLNFKYPDGTPVAGTLARSEEHTSELQSHLNLVCRLLLEKKKQKYGSHQNLPP